MLLRRVLLVTVACGLVLVAAAWIWPASNAGGLVLSDSSDCSALGGTWSVATCDFSAGLAIPGGQSLSVESGVTLLVPWGQSLTIDGTVFVYGAVNVSGVLTVDLDGSFQNEGPGSGVTIFAGGQFNALGDADNGVGGMFDVFGVLGVGSSSTFLNEGTLQVESSGIATVFGDLSNSGDLVSYGELNIAFPGELANSGQVSNYATFSISTTVELLSGGTLTNFAGTIEVRNGSHGQGEVLDEASSWVLNYADFVVSAGPAGLYVSGEFVNELGANLSVSTDAMIADDPVLGPTGSGDVDNLGTLFIVGELALEAGATLENQAGGMVQNVDLLQIGGGATFTNMGLTANSGLINNTGTTDNSAGTVSNSGTVLNECLATIQPGTVAGNPIQYIPCAPTLDPGIVSDTATPTVMGTANVASGGVGPLVIDLYAGGTLVGSSSTTDSAGDWSITTSPLRAGSYQLSAVAIDAQAIPSTSSVPSLLTVDIPTSTLVGCIPYGVPVGSATTCSATVMESGGGPPDSPRGEVDWALSPTGSGSLNESACAVEPFGVPAESVCTVSFTPGPSSEGPVTVTGSYESSNAFHSGSSGSYTLDSETLGTGTNVDCVLAEVPVGSPVRCDASVEDVPQASDLPPSLSVTWSSSSPGLFSASTNCALIPLNGSASSCSVLFTPATGYEGVITISASYAGDPDHGPSSGSDVIAAELRMASVSASCSVNPVEVNSPTVCTATVSDSSPGKAILPGGTVEFASTGSGSFEGAATCDLGGGSCSVTYLPAPGSEGSATISADYGGDQNHSGGIAQNLLSVTVRPTDTEASCGPASAPVGVSVLCTVGVLDEGSGTALTPTGTVAFEASLPGTFSSPDCVLESSICLVSFTASSGSEGTVDVTANYLGDVDHASSSVTVGLSATRRSDSTSVGCSPATVPVNSPTTCSVTVTDTSGGTAVTPTGSVQFSTGGSGTLGSPSCILSGGTCSVTYTPKSASEGSSLITAYYMGDLDHNVSSGTFGLTASVRPDTISLSCPTSIQTDESFHCSSLVDNPATGTHLTPHGKVTVAVTGPGGYHLTRSCSLSGTAGKASCITTLTVPRRGTYLFVATYVGGANFPENQIEESIPVA